MSAVEFPFMREDLLYAVKALSDIPSQVEIWINLKCPRRNYVFGFGDPFHALLDDMPMDEWGDTAIGTVLVSEQELAAVLGLTRECVRVIDQFGTLYDFADVSREAGDPGATLLARWAPSRVAVNPERLLQLLPGRTWMLDDLLVAASP